MRTINQLGGLLLLPLILYLPLIVAIGSDAVRPVIGSGASDSMIGCKVKGFLPNANLFARVRLELGFSMQVDYEVVYLKSMKRICDCAVTSGFIW